MILLWSWELALESRSENEMPSRIKSLTVPRYAIASFPGPRPASRRLQYVLQATGSWARAWERGYSIPWYCERFDSAGHLVL